jgi:hypothetical protein
MERLAKKLGAGIGGSLLGAIQAQSSQLR